MPFRERVNPKVTFNDFLLVSAAGFLLYNLFSIAVYKVRGYKNSDELLCFAKVCAPINASVLTCVSTIHAPQNPIFA